MLPHQPLPEPPRGEAGRGQLTYCPPEILTLADVRELQDFLPLLAFPFALSSAPCRDGGKMSVDAGVVQGSSAASHPHEPVYQLPRLGNSWRGVRLEVQSVTHPSIRHIRPLPCWHQPVCSSRRLRPELPAPHRQQASPSSHPCRTLCFLSQCHR